MTLTVAAISVILYTEVFFLGLLWMNPSIRERFSTVTWLQILGEPFLDGVQLSVGPAIGPGLLTAVAVVSFSAFWSRAVGGMLVGLATCLLYEGLGLVLFPVTFQAFLHGGEILVVVVSSLLVHLGPKRAGRGILEGRTEPRAT
jgi:hypothetical protein